MNYAIKLIIFKILVLLQKCEGESLCTDEFCKSYLATASCTPLPEACKIQNSTHNGIFLPSPSPCNCCEYCLENLDENKLCAIGDPSSPTPSTICGSGLACRAQGNFPTCQRMTTPCSLEQANYDSKVNSGEIGHLETRAQCDRNGFYKPYKCVPGEICFCMSAYGERIFGEVPFTPMPQFSLKCECSKMYNKAAQIEDKHLDPLKYFRCQSNGDYDTLQCIGDQCFCVDADNGHLKYPDLKPVNMTLISESSLLCFNNKMHKEAEYYKECEAVHAETLNKSKSHEADGYHVLGTFLPNCQLDGLYAPVQENVTHKYCTDSLGNRLENFEMIKSDTLSLNMNCNCARVRAIIVSDEKPECCLNGNYKKIQSRRGLCRCVDENGVQIQKEVDCTHMNQLSCYNTICS